VVDNLGDLRHKIIEDSKATRVCFKNSNSSQYLIIYHLDGANANSFNEFEIGTLINKNSKYIKLKNFELVTESNIKLGITLQDLLSSNGKPKSVTNREGLKIVRYVIKDVNNALLKKVNMPEYRAEYFFKKGILVKFVYGFPNL
jgi:RNase P/RNase MRP subunit p30